MLTPVVCFTCGCAVGDKAGIFRHLRAERVRTILAERGTVPERVMADSGLQIDCSDILDSLQIRHDCCRKTIATAMIYTDWY